MAADLARITFDPTRQYRSVITQQGRVTLEADSNEAAVIASEALRLETIDVIGPAGTPDDGYKVGSGTGPGGVSIGPGTFYLGGWRLALDAAIDLAKQPDWLDAPAATATTGNLAVALLLTEQSVCAVEDQALREVALGGPDSAARMRLMQQFLRLSVTGDTCAAAATSVASLLSAEGITVDPATLQLASAARLLAGFVPGPPNTDACAPTAAGGYLGADNQLVRVTVTAYNATAKTGTLLWGWNNASLLYRASVTNPQTLTLTGTPVDEEHAPQLGQAVEILRCRSDLTDGNFIAAPEGFVTTLTQAYSFDTGALGLADALPAEYVADSQVAKLPLFVRLWQATVPFTAGQVTPLDSVSGIAVTVTLPALPTTIALRPFWRFSVRPSTPVQIYPQRYQETPQPPDGPRQWLTDLAVVAAQASGSTLLANCRVPFLPLTQQSGACCSLVLGPNDVDGRGGLQAVMDALAGTRSSVALLAGTYTLPEPLVLGAQHSGLTLEACGPGVVLTADAGNLAAFLFGLVVLDAAANVLVRGLSFTIPNVPVPSSTATAAVTTPGTTAVATNTAVAANTVDTRMLVANTAAAAAAVGTAAGAAVAADPSTKATGTVAPGTAAANTTVANAAPANATLANAAVANTATLDAGALNLNLANATATAAAAPPATSVGILAIASPNLTVECCTFNASPDSASVFGAGLFVLGDATGLTVRRNTFAAAKYQAGAMVFGVLVSVLSANATTTLDTAELSDNVFQELPGGLVSFAQLGMVRCAGNRVVKCGTGLYFATGNLGETTEVAREAITDTTQTATLSPAVTAGMQAPMLAAILTQSAPFAAKAPAPTTSAVSDTARTALLQSVTARGATAYRSLIAPTDAAAPAAAPAAAAPAATTLAVTPTAATLQAATPAAAVTPAAAPQAATAAAPAAATVTPDPTMTNALNLVRDVSIAAELVGTTLTPVLHLAGNDVTLVATGATPGVGIAVVLSPRDAAFGMVLLTANRVVTADANTEAAAILFPTAAAVTGNVLLQTGATTTKATVPAFMLAAETTAKIEVAANVIHTTASIAPARASLPATTTWNFLNTVG
ncbi:MAG: DUF6519 domain-containing protein [Acetobacteraceae bacterium]